MIHGRHQTYYFEQLKQRLKERKWSKDTFKDIGTYSDSCTVEELTSKSED